MDLNDNIKLLLNKSTDIYVHTWDTKENHRWVKKLERYRKYCNKLIIKVELPLYTKKLHSYLYSTWKAVNTVDRIEQYSLVIKFKPNLDCTKIPYKGLLHEYFHKAYIQSRPLLEGVKKENCMYGSIYYQTIDERMFSGYPLAFKKAFHILFKDFYKQMTDLDNALSQKYGEDYEGSIFWKEWFESKGIKLIQDLDLKLPNNI